MVLLIIFSCASQSQVCEIKIMAANITSGNYQRYEDPGIRMFQALKPDICCIQEFNYNGAISDLVVKAFGTDYDYYREAYDEIPNGIIYRKDFKVLDKGSWDDPVIDNRGIVYARFDIPGENPHMLVISVHLSTQSSKQVVAANEIRKKIFAYYNLSEGQSSKIPDYLVLAGDFNAGSRNAEVLRIFKQDGLFDDSPIPVDQNMESATNASRSKDHDFVLSNDLLKQRMSVLNIKNQSFPNGLVFDSRVYTPLADVYPVQQNDSGATNMQHMPVIKVFLIPSSN